MTIVSLRISNFRNLKAIELIPCSVGLNIICGNNGSGKTSLLEAIHYLGLGRSFRSSTASRLIRHTTDQFSIFIQLDSNLERQIPLGIERNLTGLTRLRIAEKDASSIAELASYLPIRLINSQSHHLFESGPAYRRKYLDWGLFYQSEHFLSCWRQFERILKQRNAVLRDRRPKRELDIWTEGLLKYGLELDKLRREYVLALAPLVLELSQELLTIPNLELSYQPGWDTSKDYASVLTCAYGDEIRFGHTQFGPHRADLDIKINAVPARHFLSRGQQKLLICAMIIAQGKLLAVHANKRLIYLVDDLPAELDLRSRQRLISLLSKQRTQIFITAIESESISDFIGNKPEVPVKVFHVEHGNVESTASHQS